MRIGILADSHDHVWNLRAALRALNETADVLIHCGDLCSPFIVPLLNKGFRGPTHVVFGNNDGDRYRLQMKASRTERVRLHGEAFFEEFEGTRFAVQHFDDLARPLAESGQYDVVCFGHNHRHEVVRLGTAWLINPGSILGYQPTGAQDVDPSFVVYDAENDRPETWRIRDGEASVVPDESLPLTQGNR